MFTARWMLSRDTGLPYSECSLLQLHTPHLIYATDLQAQLRLEGSSALLGFAHFASPARITYKFCDCPQGLEVASRIWVVPKIWVFRGTPEMSAASF